MNPHQKAINARNDAQVLQVLLNGFVTEGGLVRAEAARKRIMQEMRDLAPVIRERRKAIREQAKADNAHRQRIVMEGVK